MNERGNSIGFLRLFFAALVVYSHAHILGGFVSWTSHNLSLGTLAVQGFFALSGALITQSWIRRSSLARYLWCRLLRIAPAFWTCLAVTAFVLTPLLYFSSPGPRPGLGSLHPSLFGYFWHNLLRPRAQIGIGRYPIGVPYGGEWNGSLWTLFYEGACYLMVAGLGLAGLLGRARRAGIALLLGVLALPILLAAHPAWLPALFRRLDDTPGKVLTLYFMAGALWTLLPRLAAAALASRWVGPAACLGWMASWHATVLPWLGPWLMPPALFWLADRLPFRNLERRIGDYSYGVYLYGVPVGQVLAFYGVPARGFPVYFTATLLGAAALAAISWHTIEKPALALKSLFRSRKETSPCAPSSVRS